MTELLGLPGKKPGQIDLLWTEDYWRQPPTIAQFIDDGYYLGASLQRTPENEGLWPSWREWLIQHADLDSFLHNLVISGAIGIGKSLLMVTLILYRICLCASLRDPYRFFGLSRGSPIHFLLLSLSQGTLRATAWQSMLHLMSASPFFGEVCGYDQEKMRAGLEMKLRIQSAGGGQQVQLTLSGGSKGQHHIGRNVLGVALDEGNFRLEQDPQAYATNLFSDLRARMVSRFQRLGGFMPGLSVVASSAGEESCFTEQLMDQIDKEADPRGQLVLRKAIYRIKPGLTLRPWWFKVWYGLPNIEPAISPGCYNEAGEPIAPPLDCPAELAKPHQPIPQGARYELVPGDYYDQFARAPRKHLQQLSGISLGGTNRVFPSLVDIHRCLELSVQEGLRAPTRASIISVSDEDARQIWDDLDHNAFVCWSGFSSFQPVRHPQRLRYVHLDLAINGLAGMAICHLADSVPPTADVSQVPGTKVVVEYDFLLTFSPGRTRPICYDKIIQFICWLRDYCGFRFGKVTADSFQSEHMLQILHAKGFATEHQSVDREKRAYLAWQGALQEHSIRLYPQAQLMKEAAQLVDTGSKIDHPPGGTKDTTDAAAGAYLNAITSQETQSLTVPQTPPLVAGISPLGYAWPANQFGIVIQAPPRPVRVFTNSPRGR